tara:strand:+ start:514 stop:741 length:228 start_codon:yes stop_codon:yes gene_type:complete
MQSDAEGKIGHELFFRIMNIRLCMYPINIPKKGAYCVIFLNFGWIKGNFGKIVKKIQAPAKSFRKFFLMSFKIYL